MKPVIVLPSKKETQSHILSTVYYLVKCLPDPHTLWYYPCTVTCTEYCFNLVEVTVLGKSSIVSIRFFILRSLLHLALLNPVLEVSIFYQKLGFVPRNLLRGVKTLPRPASGEKQNSSGNWETLEFCQKIWHNVVAEKSGTLNKICVSIWRIFEMSGRT